MLPFLSQLFWTCFFPSPQISPKLSTFFSLLHVELSFFRGNLHAQIWMRWGERARRSNFRKEKSWNKNKTEKKTIYVFFTRFIKCGNLASTLLSVPILVKASFPPSLRRQREGRTTDVELFFTLYDLRRGRQVIERCGFLSLLLSLLPNPPTVVCKMEAQLEYVHIACTFFARLAPIFMLSRCLLTKFLHY